ncbi:MAG: helix-turn-helix domain-containing protein [Epulopiscium sp.]|nr:helix-turn-helix domain-containing protein [Candidatus Epulonipiscium sp.]
MIVGKYKKQLYKTFIFISTLLVSILMFIVGISFTTNKKNHYLNTLQQAAYTKTNGADISITVITKALDDLMQSPALEKWSRADTFSDYYHSSLQAYNQLRKITADLSLVDYEIAATRLNDTSFVISRSGTISKDMFFANETSLNSQQAAYIFNHFKDNVNTLILPSYSENQLEDIYYIVKKKYNQNNMLYIVKIPYHTFFGKDKGQKFILFDRDQILAYSSIDEQNKELADSIYLASLDFAEPNDYFRYGNKNVFLSKFTGMDWTIAYIYDDIGLNVVQLLTYIIFPFILLLLLALLVSKTITERLYKPIKEVISDIVPEGSDKPIIDEFQLLKQNTNKITVLTHQLQAAIAEKNALVSQRFYRDLLFGFDIDRDIYDAYRLKSARYCVALIEFQNFIDEFSDNEIFLYKNNIYSSTQEYDSLQYININHNTCAIIIQTDTLASAKKMVLSVTSSVDENIELKISISDIKEGIDNINECFKEALKILEYKYLYDKSEILTMQQVADLVATTYYYPLLTENRLIQNIIEGKTTAIEIFDELIRENIQHRNLAPDTLKNFIFVLIGTLNRVFQELKTTPENLLNRHIDFENLYNSWNNVNIIFQIKEIISGIIETINAKNNSLDDELLADMLNYIYENYSDDIMLNDMANKFNISPKYCSALFKKLSDDTFKNFLNKYRIEKAKEFLEKDPQIKIADLSSMVGFNSSNSFIRVFGKYTGLTPKAFAEKIEAAKEE